MLRNKIGFFFGGLINNYNFAIVFSCAYALSMKNPLINPSLVILIEIIPGFITQILYPKYLYKMSYTFRWILLFFIQLISSLFLILFTSNLVFVFSSIALVSINSYLGESTMLSLSSFYQKSDLSLWSMGTGISGLVATGSYLLFNQFLSEKIIFTINFFIYLLLFCGSLLLINPKKYIINPKIDQIIEVQKQELEVNELKEKVTEVTEVDEVNEVNDLEEQIQNINENESSSISYFYFFSQIYTICLAYFINYLFGFAYIPLLVTNNFEYQISQFITRSSMFFGRIVGNYIPQKWVNYLWCLHIYNLISLMLYTICLILKISIPFFVLEILLSLTFFINGMNYPMIYHYIYENYQQDREKYMGSVGQFTAFFTVLGCLIGYPIQILLS